MIYSLMSIVVFGILICNRWSCFNKQPMGLHSAGLLSWLVVLGLSAILQFAKVRARVRVGARLRASKPFGTCGLTTSFLRSI